MSKYLQQVKVFLNKYPNGTNRTLNQEIKEVNKLTQCLKKLNKVERNELIRLAIKRIVHFQEKTIPDIIEQEIKFDTELSLIVSNSLSEKNYRLLKELLIGGIQKDQNGIKDEDIYQEWLNLQIEKYRCTLFELNEETKGGRPLSKTAPQNKIVEKVSELIKKPRFLNKNGNPKPTTIRDDIADNYPELIGDLSARQLFDRVKQALKQINNESQ